MRMRQVGRLGGAWMIVLAAGATALAKFDRGPMLQNVTQNAITICWETPEPSAATITLDGRPVDVPIEAKTRQEVRLDKLEPSRRYAWVVKLADGTEASGTFQTAPRPGEPFEFAAWGDSRTQHAECRKIADAIAATGVGLTVYSGDIVGAGRNLNEWNPQFFEPCATMLRQAVFMPVLGNHELGGSSSGPNGYEVFARMFALPGNERYYGFNYGDAHFCMLDSTEEPSRESEQYRWAERDLHGSTAKWKFVVFHHPIFDAGGHPSHLTMRTTYAPLFARAGVDLIITGHDHNYQLTRPIVHMFDPKAKRAYVQVVSGGGGAPLYEVKNHPVWLAEAKAFHHFIRIRVDGEVLRAEVIDGSGHVQDRFTIDRTKPPVDAVPYERIELIQQLEDLVLRNERGEPLHELVEPQGGATSVRLGLSNELPKPITAAVDFVDGAAGVVLEPNDASIVVPPARDGKPGMATLRLAVRVKDASDVYPMPRLRTRVTSPFGRDEAWSSSRVGLAVRRTLAAPRVAAANAAAMLAPDAAAWKDVKANEAFLRYGDDSPAPKDNPEATALRVVHDGESLIVRVRAEFPADRPPSAKRDVATGDHVGVTLAGPERIVRVNVAPNGRSAVEGVAADRVTAKARRGEREWIAVVRIPLEAVAAAKTGGSGADAKLRLNVYRKHGRNQYVWSPTFGRTPDYGNSATLTLE